MKKVLSFIMAIALIAALAVSVGAASFEVNGDTYAKQGPGMLSLKDGGVIDYETSDAQSIWGGIESVAGYDMSNGIEIKVTDIKWDKDENTAVVVIIGDRISERTWITAKHGTTLMLTKDGTAKFWGIADSNYYGDTNTEAEVADEGFTEFTFSLVPSADYLTWTVYVNGEEVQVYDQVNKNGWPGMLASMNEKYLGFGVLNGDDTHSLTIPGNVSFKVSSIRTPNVVTVNGEKAAFAYPGEEVTLNAPAVEGQLFKEWTAAEGVELGDKTAASLTFTMPEADVAFTAAYEEDPNATTEATTTDAPTTSTSTTDDETTAGDAGTTDAGSVNDTEAGDSEKGGIHPAIIVVIVIAVVGVVVVVVVLKKKK